MLVMATVSSRRAYGYLTSGHCVDQGSRVSVLREAPIALQAACCNSDTTIAEYGIPLSPAQLGIVR